MLHIQAVTDKIEARLEAMTTSIKTFGTTDMPQELTNWQVDDMHRKYPETQAGEQGADEVNASTMIYPRSRTYEQTHPHRGHVVARPKRQLSSMPVLRHSGLQHPILRQVLLDKLFTRMTSLLSEKITWQSTSR